MRAWIRVLFEGHRTAVRLRRLYRANARRRLAAGKRRPSAAHGAAGRRNGATDASSASDASADASTLARAPDCRTPANGPAVTVAKVVVTVGEFSKRLQEVFRRVRAFDYIGISGEVSEWTPRANGVYFTLKDAQAVLQCFAHHSRARNFPPVTLGSAVVAYGNVRLAEWRSRYELLVDSVEFTGIGELFRQYEALKERFRAMGSSSRVASARFRASPTPSRWFRHGEREPKIFCRR